MSRAPPPACGPWPRLTSLRLRSSRIVSILEERRREHVKKLAEALAPSEDRRRPETSACIKAVVDDIVKMHKTLQPLLTRHQLHAVFTQARAVCWNTIRATCTCTCHGAHIQNPGACICRSWLPSTLVCWRRTKVSIVGLFLLGNASCKTSTLSAQRSTSCTSCLTSFRSS